MHFYEIAVTKGNTLVYREEITYEDCVAHGSGGFGWEELVWGDALHQAHDTYPDREGYITRLAMVYVTWQSPSREEYYRKWGYGYDCKRRVETGLGTLAEMCERPFLG